LEWVGIFRGADLVEGGLGTVDKDFILLTSRTSLHVLGNPMVHSWPGKMSLSLSDRFVLPGMACGGVVVDQGHEISLLGLGYSANNDRSCELFGWEYNHVLIVFLALIGSRGSRKDVWPCVGFPRYVVNDEIVFLQVRVPPGCMPVKVFRGFPILEVRMVGKDDEGEFSLSQVVSPMG
jgi:hypothetical protein